jgi:hypothetical protein
MGKLIFIIIWNKKKVTTHVLWLFYKHGLNLIKLETLHYFFLNDFTILKGKKT